MEQQHAIAQRLATRLGEGTGEPASHVIVEDLWLGVIDGTLEVGEHLPTARELAVALRVSPRTVERAYAELERRGVIASRPGEGVMVALARPAEEELARRRELLALCEEVLERAAALGFDAPAVLDMVADLESARRPPSHAEPES